VVLKFVCFVGLFVLCGLLWHDHQQNALIEKEGNADSISRRYSILSMDTPPLLTADIVLDVHINNEQQNRLVLCAVLGNLTLPEYSRGYPCGGNASMVVAFRNSTDGTSKDLHATVDIRISHRGSQQLRVTAENHNMLTSASFTYRILLSPTSLRRDLQKNAGLLLNLTSLVTNFASNISFSATIFFKALLSDISVCVNLNDLSVRLLEYLASGSCTIRNILNQGTSFVLHISTFIASVSIYVSSLCSSGINYIVGGMGLGFLLKYTYSLSSFPSKVWVYVGTNTVCSSGGFVARLKRALRATQVGGTGQLGDLLMWVYQHAYDIYDEGHGIILLIAGIIVISFIIFSEGKREVDSRHYGSDPRFWSWHGVWISTLAHIDQYHLLHNIVALIFIGGDLHAMLLCNFLTFILLYCLSTIASSYASWRYRHHIYCTKCVIVYSLGASGAISGLQGAMFALGSGARGEIIRNIVVHIGTDFIRGFVDEKAAKVDVMAHVGGLLSGAIIGTFFSRIGLAA
jgi:membrane associated rhomboid family serine protease